MNQCVCSLIHTKIQRCSLPTGVFTSRLTLLSKAVIPLIYYGMVIGWGVAMTPSRQIMNHVRQNISLYPVTPKEVITRDRKRFWWSTAALKPLLRCCHDSFFDYLYSVLIRMLSFSWCGGQPHPYRTVTADLNPPPACRNGGGVQMRAVLLVMWGPSFCVCLWDCAGFLAPTKRFGLGWVRKRANVPDSSQRFGFASLQMWWKRYLGQLEGGDTTCVEHTGVRWFTFKLQVPDEQGEENGLCRLWGKKKNARMVYVMTTAVIFINLCPR